MTTLSIVTLVALTKIGWTKTATGLYLRDAVCEYEQEDTKRGCYSSTGYVIAALPNVFLTDVR